MGQGLGQYVGPSDADQYVVEGSVHHLTWDVIAWISSVFPEWSLVRIRYEWERLIEKSRGKDLFLELTYKSTTGADFPCHMFSTYPLVQWHVYFVDYVEYQYTKVISRMVLNEDYDEPPDES
jgi:hypothetical protein